VCEDKLRVARRCARSPTPCSDCRWRARGRRAVKVRVVGCVECTRASRVTTPVMFEHSARTAHRSRTVARRRVPDLRSQFGDRIRYLRTVIFDRSCLKRTCVCEGDVIAQLLSLFADTAGDLMMTRIVRRVDELAARWQRTCVMRDVTAHIMSLCWRSECTTAVRRRCAARTAARVWSVVERT
jgi:hypothetical protein